MAKSRIKKNTRVKKRDKVRRRKKKKAKRILKGVGKLSLSFLIVAGFAVAGKKTEDFFFTSPRFRISEVNFKGINCVKKKTLEKLAGVELGKNIFRVDLGEIRERLQKHPQVRDVVVSRQFPQTVEIKVEEREAIAFVKNAGKIYPVDKEGFIMSENFLFQSLPLIMGLGEDEMKVGERIEEKKLVEALEILEMSPSFGLSISEIALDGQSPVVRIGDVKIFLGKEEEREKELKKLKAILNDLGKRKESAEYIDLRFSNPVIKIQ